MRVLLTLAVLTLAVAVALGGYGTLPLVLGLVVALEAFDALVDELRRRAARRAIFGRGGYQLPVDDIAPHLRALRSSTASDLGRADELAHRLTPDDAMRISRAGAAADVALRDYRECRLELATLVEAVEVRPDPLPPPPLHAPPPRVLSSFDDEHTGTTRELAS